MPLDSDVVSAKKSEKYCLLTGMGGGRKSEWKSCQMLYGEGRRKKKGRGRRSVGKVAEGGDTGGPSFRASRASQPLATALQRSNDSQPSSQRSCPALAAPTLAAKPFCPRCR